MKAKMNLNGDFTLKGLCNETEASLLRNLITNNDLRNIFELDNLYDELIEGMIKYNIVKHSDKRLQSFKTYYGLFVCVSLDKSRLKMSKIKATLSVAVSSRGMLAVMARSTLFNKSGSEGPLDYMAPFFLTEINASDVMTPDVQKLLSNAFMSHGELELTADEKLVFI